MHAAEHRAIPSGSAGKPPGGRLCPIMKIEPFDIRSIVSGSLRLDGGAMFGVVPKTLWHDKVDVDEDNRILLATRTLLAVDETGGQVIVVETGCGPKWSGKLKERYAVEFLPLALDDALAERRLSRNDVTDVIISHLHFDHNGGLTEWAAEPGGATKLRFPNAKHWVHRNHWQHAQNPSPRDRASFILEDFGILKDSPLLELVDGDEPACPIEAVEWFVSQGHTPYQLHAVFGTGARKLLFLGDMVPTVDHLPTAWVMAYDLLPLSTVTEKEALYRRCRAEELILAFPHDPQHPAVIVDTTTAHPVVTTAVDL